MELKDGGGAKWKQNIVIADEASYAELSLWEGECEEVPELLEETFILCVQVHKAEGGYVERKSGRDDRLRREIVRGGDHFGGAEARQRIGAAYLGGALQEITKPKNLK